jgi:hypothetical protein
LIDTTKKQHIAKAWLNMQQLDIQPDPLRHGSRRCGIGGKEWSFKIYEVPHFIIGLTPNMSQLDFAH